MRKKRTLSDIALLMFLLNLVILLYYSIICLVTTFRICQSFGAYHFLASVRNLPPYPWRMPLESLSLYFFLCLISYMKNKWEIHPFLIRLFVCAAEILLCAWLIAALRFYYSGIALLVLADLVHYVRRNRFRLCFMVILVMLFALGKYEILLSFTGQISFQSYLRYYSPTIQGYLTGMESILLSLNVLLFVSYIILLFTGQKEENIRIGRLNRQLHEANAQLRDYAVRMERMTEIRERNRLAREIHDTLGHSLTGIIMAADAGLTLFDTVPQEAKKYIQIIAQSARDGLNDVRRSIKALRPDTFEQHSLETALEKLISNFRLTTSTEIGYEQTAGCLDFASDEEDTLYRIVQESMTNAVRHGHATHIEIRLSRETNLVTVDVRDNGQGCNQLIEGFGLRHMRERLELLGGTLTCGNCEESSENDRKGFFICAKVPIRGHGEEFK